MLAAGFIAIGLAASPGVHFEAALRPLRQVSLPKQIASLSAQECAVCHAAIYRQWRSSRHRMAWDNPIFAAAFRAEPMSWCIYCHAPLPEQAALLIGARQAKVPSPLVAEGITCAVCHVRDGRILSAKRPSQAALAAHPMREEPQLARSEFCGSCHQFNIPDDAPPLHYTDEPMQNTLAEWQATRAAQAGQSCQHCHMPRAEHRFPGAHDSQFLRASISVKVSRNPDGSIAALLQVSEVGHNVPTGDPFRRLTLRFCDEPACPEVLGSLTWQRVFQKLAGVSRVAVNSTLPAPTAQRPAERSATVRELGPEATHYQLVYSYAARGAERHLSAKDTAVILSQGRIADTEAK